MNSSKREDVKSTLTQEFKFVVAQILLLVHRIYMPSVRFFDVDWFLFLYLDWFPFSIFSWVPSSIVTTFALLGWWFEQYLSIVVNMLIKIDFGVGGGGGFNRKMWECLVMNYINDIFSFVQRCFDY